MINRSLLLFLLMAGILFGKEDLKVGDKAPEFSLPDETGKIHKLSDYAGKILALYFYPKDDTPGCTAEACNLRDNNFAMEEEGVVILGVSYDDPESHREFIKKHDLPFHLLSDTTKEVAKSYNAKSLIYGWMVPDRITYLIDPDGKIMAIIEDVDTDAHAKQILEYVKSGKQE